MMARPAAGTTRGLEYWRDLLRRAVPLNLESISLAAGLRSATACAFPVLLAELFNAPSLSWIAIVAFWGCLADNGGAWRTRFLAMASFTGLAALGSFLGLLASASLFLSVPLVFIWTFFCGIARIYGAGAASIGLLLSINVLVVLGMPGAGLDEALDRATLSVIGGCWATLLALVIWRLHPHGPAREAVGQCWRQLGGLARALSALHRDGSAADADWARVARERRRAAREAIETAREVLTRTRAARRGHSHRGEMLLVMLVDAEQVFEALIGLSEWLELGGHGERQPVPAMSAQRGIRVALGRLAEQAEALAVALITSKPPERVDLAAAIAAARGRIAAAAGADAAYAQAMRLLERIARFSQVAVETVEGVRAPPDLLDAIAAKPDAPLFDIRAALTRLRDNLTLDSIDCRHALRMAVTAALAEGITTGFALERGYWLSITAIVILQPYMAATWRRSLERVAGSVLGGVVAAGLSLAVQTPMAITAVIFPLSMLAMAMRGVNYAVFTFCLTPQFILIAELFQSGGNAGGWSLAGLRALDSVIGGGVGLIIGFTLWPGWEAPHLPARLADAVASNARLLDAVLAGEGGDVLHALRRRAGLDSNAAEASVQRLLAEPRRHAARVAEPALTILTGVRRLAGAAVALSLLPPDSGAAAPMAASRAWMIPTLADLTAAIGRGEAPPPAAEPPAIADDAAASLALRDLARAQRQVEIIHGAAARLAAQAA